MNSKKLFHRIFSGISTTEFAVEYWDKEIIQYGNKSPKFVLYLKDKDVCNTLFSNLSLNVGEAYTSGAIDIQGDLQKFLQLAYTVDPRTFDLTWAEKMKITYMHLRQRNTLKRSKSNIAHHYDLGNDFFSLWLGREMAYSCAYFQTPDDDIDTAQRQKFDHICKKLQLKEGEMLIDIGCGWGGLASYAAQRYGVKVLGITLSKAQKELADKRISELGLKESVKIELMDYREIPLNSYFDKVVSIGMLEHVGKENFHKYFSIISRILKKGGVGLVQSIGHVVEHPVTPWIRKYIFPGMYLPTLDNMAKPMGRFELNITDVEVLRLHYALTLDKWLYAYENNIVRIREMYDEQFVKMWRLYLNVCCVSFRYGETCLWQVQFTKGLNNTLPLTRNYLYTSSVLDQIDKL
jgi:cyclopropane-fatty-acyl-phospholipid synthase